ncbi:hypothetical protein IFY47_003410 [Salmonella enterica]|nr:hypothetical protein [Salmonella enterica]
MSDYYKQCGDQTHFNDAPPLAEVVLEDISRKVKRLIYAEAFRPGANWWHADGRPGRRGLPADRMSDYTCIATRTPRPASISRLSMDQLAWDGQFFDGYDQPMPVAIELPPLTARQSEEFKQQLNEARKEGEPTVMKSADAFVSVFEPQHADYWVRINTAGRVKFSEALMLRFIGMKLDIAVDSATGRVRIGEADHGKVMSGRGYVYARRLVPMLDFKGSPSVVVYLALQPDGYLYGALALAEVVDGADVEG